MLQPLVDQFGAAKVWAASETLFGYPPTWNLSVNDIASLNSFLSQGFIN